ncbi:CCDC93 N-terminal domain-containing protein [Caenorhabditis elegans]|uniref:CCDC93 N-terminal domain-containing protein n=2 Tax=Caenorhabditis elegans TaxID=6239 RepID=H2KYD0_CAEEL|nr:Coiled-coil domain-containing protein 93 [Caenorhabditis elegans]CCD62418.1 Coiled-coil domain-containing protein 93 [Caenorhabditis elegans]|eukprot:NP_001021959.1 Uncharacterized protein CELE_C16A11.2 [Caenorhabditis elegans]
MDLNAAAAEKPETSSNCRNDIIAMLSASGYHRARVSCLNDYDKIVGGIVWAIMRCDDVDVAVDLLYEESEDQNIKLRTEQSEKLIEALKAVQCPHEIATHQISGLDFLALKNVIQWLLRHVLAQESKGNKFKHFTEWFSMHHEHRDEALKDFRHHLRRGVTTTRYMKRFDNSAMFNLSMDAKCTLAEYVVYSRTGDRLVGFTDETEETDNLKEASTKKHVPTTTVRKMMDEAVVETFKNDTESIKTSREGMCKEVDELNIPQRLEALESLVIDEAELFQQVKDTHKQLSDRYNTIKNRVVSNDQMFTFYNSNSDLDQLAEIVKFFEVTQARADELRACAECDVRMAQNHENLLRQNRDKNGKMQKYCVKQREIVDDWAERMKMVYVTCRDVVALQFRLDRYLKTLISHYRKRHMEKLLESSELTQEAKTNVIDHNVTIDILTFSAKIKGFMDEVEKSLVVEPASQEYRDAFVSYMNDVRTQLGEYHWKAKLTQDKTLAEKDTLAALRTRIRQKEREVSNTSDEMKRMLKIYESLKEVDSLLAQREEISPAFQYALDSREAEEEDEEAEES